MHAADGGQREGKFSHSGRVAGKLYMNGDVICVSSCKTGSTHIPGCMVRGMIARAAS